VAEMGDVEDRFGRHICHVWRPAVLLKKLAC
jgi:hypothetical protein